MLSKTLAMFLSDDDFDKIGQIKHIYNFFKNEYDDIFVISNENENIDQEYAVVPSIYLKFFRGDLVFSSFKSYFSNEDVLANNIYVCASIKELVSNHIHKNRLNNVKILSVEESKIEVFNYAKL
jgi:hypothetical protein